VATPFRHFLTHTVVVVVVAAAAVVVR